jgi:hypothetical protein
VKGFELMTSDLLWALIRQDGGENRYRVGRFATRAEAEHLADQLDLHAGVPEDAMPRRYVVERIASRLAHT